MSMNQRYKRILENQDFLELVKKRNRFAWMLSSIMFASYYLFILIVAFAPELFGQPIYEGAVTTLGIPSGIFVIILSFVLTGIYIRRANKEFDALTKEIIRESAL